MFNNSTKLKKFKDKMFQLFTKQNYFSQFMVILKNRQTKLKISLISYIYLFLNGSVKLKLLYIQVKNKMFCLMIAIYLLKCFGKKESNIGHCCNAFLYQKIEIHLRVLLTITIEYERIIPIPNAWETNVNIGCIVFVKISFMLLVK